jgi:hypothetical protein
LSDSELVLTVVTTVIGAIIGIITAHYYYRKGGAARAALVITMEERARIDPSTVGVRVDMKIGTITVTNLVVLEIAVTNRGHRDLVVDDASDPEKHALRPRVELPEGLRSLADPWNPEGSGPTADVRIARQLGADNRQVFFVHLHRLAKGETSRARLLCTYRTADPPPPLVGDELRFFPGFLPNVDVRVAGLLRDSARARA